MTVELAVVIPVVVVVALIVFNLMRFVALCARFDRVSLDAVIAQGVSPPGEQGDATAVEGVERAVSESFAGSEGVSVETRIEPAGASGEEDSVFSLAPNLSRFVCTLEVRPWPDAFVIAGVASGTPFRLSHERSLVVDRYRPGVVV